MPRELVRSSCQAHVSKVCVLIRMGHVCRRLLIRNALQGALMQHRNVALYLIVWHIKKTIGENIDKRRKGQNQVLLWQEVQILWLVLLMIILHHGANVWNSLPWKLLFFPNVIYLWAQRWSQQVSIFFPLFFHGRLESEMGRQLFAPICRPLG